MVVGSYEGLPAVDTNRSWCAKLPLLARLYPQTWVVACVRGVGAIMDSFERLAHATPQEPSGIHEFDPGTPVYGRIGAPQAGDGAMGFALDVLRGLHLAGGAVAADGERAISPCNSGMRGFSATGRGPSARKQRVFPSSGHHSLAVRTGISFVQP